MSARVCVQDVAIVGSGPSAIYTLQHLLSSAVPLRITLFEAGARAGVGTPYDPATTSVDLLANIASIEMPPVCETLLAFLARSSDAELEAVGVDRTSLGEREFFPRVALGAYYASQLSQLQAQAAASGSFVTILTQHRVEDVKPRRGGLTVLYRTPGARLAGAAFDQVVLATGHSTSKRQGALPERAGDVACPTGSIGILGSSLSAIDIAISIATSCGSFVGDGFEPSGQAGHFHITMMSRGGRLPEIDFFCPLPAEPAAGFTEADVEAIVRSSASGTVLDAVFARFAGALSRLDPAYAAAIGLVALTADTFASAYFSARDARDPFAGAAQDLATSRQHAAYKHVVPWKYAILRMHEAFACCLDALDETELERFNRGMKSVFIDNYAAVPPLSIERLLALHASGHLSLLRLGDDYELDIEPSTGAAEITIGAGQHRFEHLFDARGQAAADEDAFPFPTLRMLLKANGARNDDGGGSVQVEDDYALSGGLNPMPGVYCLSLPFLLARQPFIQGLTSAADMGRSVAEAILEAGGSAAPDSEPVSLEELVETVEQTSPIFIVGTGEVILAGT